MLRRARWSRSCIGKQAKIELENEKPRAFFLSPESGSLLMTLIKILILGQVEREREFRVFYDAIFHSNYAL